MQIMFGNIILIYDLFMFFSPLVLNFYPVYLINGNNRFDEFFDALV